jgi:hypothetical protein
VKALRRGDLIRGQPVRWRHPLLDGHHQGRAGWWRWLLWLAAVAVVAVVAGGGWGSRAETAPGREQAGEGLVPEVPPLRQRNPGGGAFTFLRRLCYHAVHERIRIQEQNLSPPGEKMRESYLRQIWEKTHGHCHFCGDLVEFEKRGWKDGDLNGYWEVDHVIQKGKGGSKSFENCLPACTRCNRLRWHRHGEEV